MLLEFPNGNWNFPLGLLHSSHSLVVDAHMICSLAFLENNVQKNASYDLERLTHVQEYNVVSSMIQAMDGTCRSVMCTFVQRAHSTAVNVVHSDIIIIIINGYLQCAYYSSTIGADAISCQSKNGATVFLPVTLKKRSPVEKFFHHQQTRKNSKHVVEISLKVPPHPRYVATSIVNVCFIVDRNTHFRLSLVF